MSTHGLALFVLGWTLGFLVGSFWMLIGLAKHGRLKGIKL